MVSHVVDQDRLGWLLGTERPVRAIPAGMGPAPTPDLLQHRPLAEMERRLATVAHGHLDIYEWSEGGRTFVLELRSRDRAALERYRPHVAVRIAPIDSRRADSLPVGVGSLVASSVEATLGENAMNGLLVSGSPTLGAALGEHMESVQKHAIDSLRGELARLRSVGVITAEDVEMIQCEALVADYLEEPLPPRHDAAEAGPVVEIAIDGGGLDAVAFSLVFPDMDDPDVTQIPKGGQLIYGVKQKLTAVATTVNVTSGSVYWRTDKCFAATWSSCGWNNGLFEKVTAPKTLARPLSNATACFWRGVLEASETAAVAWISGEYWRRIS